MAEITLTTANVRSGAGGQPLQVTGSGAIAIGDMVAPDGTKYQKASKASQIEAQLSGFAISTCDADGDTFVLLKPGSTLKHTTAVFTKGQTYVLSTNGKMMDAGDITTGDWVTIVGVAKSTTELEIIGTATGIET